MTERKIQFGKPIIGQAEKQAVLDVLAGDILVHGPRAKQFEQDFSAFVKGGHSVSVASCTAALHLSYFYLGLGAGDEVIVPAQTHNATAHAVELCGAKPVFVDAELKTGNIAIDQIEAALTPRTKAISIVHYLGMPVDMQKVNAIAKKHNLFVVEDCALAMGSYFEDQHAGLLGDVGCFSFYPVKHMTTAEGGMLLTKHKEIAEKIARQKAFGVDRTVAERQVPGVYDVTMLGFNYRLNELASALGIEQLKRMPDFLNKRRENYQHLAQGLSELAEISLFESSNTKFQSSYYCLSAILDQKIAAKRFEIVASLNAQGVGTSVYYPRPVPHFSYYSKKYGYTPDTFPIAKKISDNTIAFPVGPHLSLDDMQYIVEAMKNALGKAL